MTLLGNGVLAIWNGIAEEAEADFVAWHVGEHIPERVGLPGFLRGRRYVAVDGHPKYFNFYETDTVAALASPVYLARLDDPTPWTRRVVPHFRDTIRTICEVAVSLGCGEGAFVEALRLNMPTAAGFDEQLAAEVLPGIVAAPGIVGVHLLRGDPSAGGGGSAEKAMRAEPDGTADWILLIEAVEAAFLSALRDGVAAAAVFTGMGGGDPVERGIYRLQFALTKRELEQGGRPRP